MSTDVAEHVLQDILSVRLKVVFCGTRAGLASRQRKAYYAGRGNKFWRTQHELELTPHRFEPEDYHRLLEFGIGLTDLAKRSAGGDAALRREHFHIEAFQERMARFAPAIIAFNGKRAAAAALGKSTKSLTYGASGYRIGESAVHVLPSTSGAAAAYWDFGVWAGLAAAVRELT